MIETSLEKKEIPTMIMKNTKDSNNVKQEKKQKTIELRKMKSSQRMKKNQKS